MLGGRDKNQFEQVWQKKAEQDELPLVYQPGNERVDQALRIIPPGSRFLDIGCGTGVLAQKLKGRYTEVHGTDIAEMPVQVAHQNGVQAVVHNLNTTPLPYEDQFFDLVTALSVFQYFYDLDFALSEIGRVMKPSGTLLVSVPNMRAIWRIGKLALAGTFPRTSMDAVGYDGGALHYFCYRDMVHLLNEHGFNVTGSYGMFCIPGMMKAMPDRGLPGALKREFFSAEILIMARKR
jgi:methionine biosynthesis protein MetW